MSISGKITEILKEEKIIQYDEVELYEYSINAVLEMGSNIVTTLVLGILFHKFIMSVLFLAVVIPFRSVIGGWHAKHSVTCFVISILYYLGAVWLPQYFLSVPMSAFLCIFLILESLIWWLAPVDCVQKPLDDQEKERMRKYARIILIIILFLFCLMMFLGYKQLYIELVTILITALVSLVAEKIHKFYVYDHSCAKNDHS